MKRFAPGFVLLLVCCGAGGGRGFGNPQVGQEGQGAVFGPIDVGFGGVFADEPTPIPAMPLRDQVVSLAFARDQQVTSDLSLPEHKQVAISLASFQLRYNLPGFARAGSEVWEVRLGDPDSKSVSAIYWVDVADLQVMPIVGPWNEAIFNGEKKVDPKVVAKALSPTNVEGPKNVQNRSDPNYQLRLRRQNEQRAIGGLPSLNYIEGASPQMADAPLDRIGTPAKERLPVPTRVDYEAEYQNLLQERNRVVLQQQIHEVVSVPTPASAAGRKPADAERLALEARKSNPDVISAAKKSALDDFAKRAGGADPSYKPWAPFTLVLNFTIPDFVAAGSTVWEIPIIDKARDGQVLGLYLVDVESGKILPLLGAWDGKMPGISTVK